MENHAPPLFSYERVSGMPLRKLEIREMRERLQRLYAKRRARQEWRSFPKGVRERIVQEQKSAALSQRVSADIEEQSGPLAYLGSIALASVSVLAGKAIHSLRKADRLTDETHGVVSEYGKPVAAFNKAVDKIVSAVRSFVEGVKKLASGLWELIFGVLCYAVHKCTDFGGVVKGLFTGLIRGFSPAVADHIENLVEEQSGDMMSLVGYLSSLACTLFVPGQKPSWQVGEIMKRVANFERAQSGFTAIFEGALGIAESIVNAILGMVSDKSVTFVGGMRKEVLAWAAKVDAFHKLNSMGNPTTDDLVEAQRVLQEGFNLKNLVKAAPLRGVIDKNLDRLNGWLMPHRGLLENMHSFRQAPVFVMLGGASAVGKTTLLAHLATCTLLLAGEVTPKDAMSQLWQKGTTEYWNGYCGQKCYVMDDCMQEHCVAGQKDSEAIQIIRAVGSWPYPLNFANIEDKGRWYFVSKLIVGTTNVKNMSTAVEGIIRCPEAVVRRVDHGYWMSVSPAFRTEAGTLDYAKLEVCVAAKKEALLARLEAGEKVTRDDVLMSYPWEAWTLNKHTFGSAEPGVVVDTIDAVRSIAQQLKDRTERHAKDVGNTQTWLDLLGRIEDQVGRYDASASSTIVCDSVGTIFERHLASEDSAHSVHRDRWGDLWLEDEATLDSWEREALALLEPSESVTAESRQPRYLKRGPPARPGPKDAVSAVLRAFQQIDQWLGAVTQRLLEWLSVLPAFIAEPLAVILPNACALGICYASYKLASAAISKVFALVKGLCGGVYCALFGAPEAQSVHNRSDPMERSFPVRKNKVRKFPGVADQLGNPPKDGVNRIVRDNGYLMASANMVYGVITFMCDTLFIMPKHFIRALELEKAPSVTLTSVAQPDMQVVVPVSSVLSYKRVEVEDSDMVYVKMDRGHIRSHRNIIRHTLTEASLALVYDRVNLPVRLDVTRVNDGPGGGIERVVYHSKTVRYMPQLVTATSSSANVFTYDAQTVAGDCGAPLTIAEPRNYNGACFLGIHVAGKVNVLSRAGYAVVISREATLQACKVLGVFEDKFSEDLESRGIALVDEFVDEQCGVVSGSALYVGKVDKPVASANQTKLFPSGIPSGILPDLGRRPARLRPFSSDGEMVYPMRKAMANYFTPVELVEVRNHEAIMALAMKKHWEATANCSAGVLSYEQALCGVEGRGIKAMCMRSSPGYPARLECSSKRDLLCGADGVDFAKEGTMKLRDRVEYVVEQARCGVRLAHVYTDFLKDELRADEKVCSGESRAISGSPVDYIVACRQYFGSYLAACHETFVESGMAPGINPYSDWHLLAEKLGFGKSPVFAGDFKRFDASQQPAILCYILEYINNWYTRGGASPEDNRVREVLFLDLIHSRHLTGEANVLDTVVQWNKSLPSGHPLTTVVNSMFSLFTLTACYVDLTGDLTCMWDKVYLCTYGDDNVAKVDDTVIEVFNQVTVAEAMQRLFSLTYTSDVKGAELTPSQPFDTISFLKRKFKAANVGGGWLAPLELPSIFSCLCWLSDKKDPLASLSVNVHGSSTELALHGEEVWRRWMGALQPWLLSIGVVPPHVSYEHALTEALARTQDWF